MIEYITYAHDIKGIIEAEEILKKMKVYKSKLVEFAAET